MARRIGGRARVALNQNGRYAKLSWQSFGLLSKGCIQRKHPPMAVSIDDVAQRANVSTSTVSRVINGRNIVNAETRQRVEAAIRELGYRPNVFARGLMLQRSHILGFVLPDLHGEFYSEIIRGANLRAKSLAYHLILASITPDDDEISPLSSRSAHGMVDGLAVMVSELTERSYQELRNALVPVVLLDGTLPDSPHDSVQIDQRSGTVALIRHVIAHCGIRRVVFVGGHSTNLDTMERLRACRDVLRDNGLEIFPHDVHYLNYEYDTAFSLGERCVHDWAGVETCVFAANDEMAAGIVHAALSRGVSVPTNLRVVGFDDTRLARIMRPRLTTVHVPMQELGATAVQLLVDRLADPGAPPRSVVLEPQLIVRDSCGSNETHV
jgi:LacI family transcriptional regulator